MCLYMKKLLLHEFLTNLGLWQSNLLTTRPCNKSYTSLFSAFTTTSKEYYGGTHSLFFDIIVSFVFVVARIDGEDKTKQPNTLSSVHCL